MKRSLTSLTFGVALVVSITLNASSMMGQQKDAKRCPAGVKPALDRAASTALEAIKKGQPKSLMPLLSEKGVVLGVDGPLVRLASIRREILAKTSRRTPPWQAAPRSKIVAGASGIVLGGCSMNTCFDARRVYQAEAVGGHG